MKQFNLKRSKKALNGDQTQMILEFLIYDGDAVLYTNNLVTVSYVMDVIETHRLQNFMEVRGYKKEIKTFAE